jgi:hypothetical protein
MKLSKKMFMLNNLPNFKALTNQIMFLKALYGLKPAPRAWYEKIKWFLIEKKFSRGNVDITIFIKRSKEELLLVQIYMDDIIFDSSSQQVV